MTTLLQPRYPSHLHRPRLRAANTVDPSLVQATWAASQEVDDPISRPRGGWWTVSDWATTTRPMVDDGEVIGLVAVHATRGDTVAEARLALLPAGRTHGAARSLVDAALRMAREASAERLRLVVPRAADWAAEAARRAGFEPIRETYVMLRPISAGPLTSPTEPAVRVRPIRAGEEPTLLAALNRAWAGTWGFSPIPADALAGDLHGQRDGMLVATDAGDDSRIVATVHAIFDPETGNLDGGPYAWISNLTTDPDWRGRGLGRLMLGRGIRSLQERGAESAMLGVDGGNTAAVGLYRSAGFGVVGITDIWERPLRGLR